MQLFIVQFFRLYKIITQRFQIALDLGLVCPALILAEEIVGHAVGVLLPHGALLCLPRLIAPVFRPCPEDAVLRFEIGNALTPRLSLLCRLTDTELLIVDFVLLLEIIDILAEL